MMLDDYQFYYFDHVCIHHQRARPWAIGANDDDDDDDDDGGGGDDDDDDEDDHDDDMVGGKDML